MGGPAADASELERIRRVFSDHPLRESRILARLRRDGIDLDHLNERDLAEDPRSGITDQNHIGGRALAIALATRAGLRPGTRALDLCSGLGGTARVLADTFGCRAVGLEITPARCRDAVSLSRRVGLLPRVASVLGDARALPFADGRFDAVVGQSSWSHMADKAILLAEAARVVRPGGVVAFEDAVLGPHAPEHTAAIAMLAEYWCFHIVTAADWRAHLLAAGLRLRSVEDLTSALAHDTRRILDYLRRQYGPGGAAPHRERWRGVLALVDAAALCYARFVADKPGTP